MSERKNMTPSVESMKKGTCGCGRSPTGDCIGWHNLTNESYQKKLAEHQDSLKQQLLNESVKK